MSLLAATQIPKPADEQAFERASVILWRGLLDDPSVQRNGRRGQRQNGVDLFGVRDGDADWHVGIQCKLKSDGHFLSEKEVRGEVKKALTFMPALKEYYVTTTAPDDVAMQELAREITKELATAGEAMRVYVWGWNTLEEQISEHAEARRAFDPTSTLFSEEILAETRSISAGQGEMRNDMVAGFSRLETMLAKVSGQTASPPDDSTAKLGSVEAYLDAEIDGYRELSNSGKSLTAMPLLENLLARVGDSASGRILFRLKANIGHCLLAVGKDKDAADMLLAAYEHAPDEPKAIANKAFGLLLRRDWRELLEFGKLQLEADPTNEWLAGYLVQAARFDASVTDPLALVPRQLHETAAVQVGRVDFVRRRGEPGEWWTLARAALEMYPDAPQTLLFAAEADLDEVLSSQRFQRMRILSPAERQRVEAATTVLASQWDRERAKDDPLRPEHAALCVNVMLGLATLDEFSKALEVARQGLDLVPDDAELLVRTADVAFEAGDEELARELLPRLPTSADSVVLRFRFHAARGDWSDVVSLFESSASLIPPNEEPIIATTAKLASINMNVKDAEDRRRQLVALADEAARDPRASIVVADFALREEMTDIADAAFEAALRLIDDDSHMADRQMVAHHANRRGDAAIVVDLLAGRVAEDHDSDELRMLARAYVNDTPIRQRALSFFGRLPENVRELPYYLNAKGLLHFNRGALIEAESALRRGMAAQPDLDNLLSLFSVLHRLDRSDEVKTIVDEIDLATIKGTADQKMILAQVMRRIGQGQRALEYAYDVLRSARNDQKAVLRYFGLLMLDPEDGLIPSSDKVAVDTWIRLQNDRNESHAFLIEEGEDRPADDVLSPLHPVASAAFGLQVGDEFEMAAGHGGVRRWRVAEIKHKYLHALHDVMVNFESRFPNADGFYTIAMKEGDIQPALDEVRRVAESNRNSADLYLKSKIPLSFIFARGDRDTIRFVEYIRSLDFDIRACLGTEPERLAARNLLEDDRSSGAVLDAYTAWTLSTMGAFDVLQSVFGELFIPQTVVDEIKNLRDEHDSVGESTMTVTWHDGQFVRQEHSAEDISARREYIVEQLSLIEAACSVRPVVAPDEPTDAAILITQSIDSHALDAANLAGSARILVSEDLYYRQIAEASCAARGVWLQAIFSFAHETGLISDRRYADLVVKLAWRRHGHLALNPSAMLSVFRDDPDQGIENFKAIANFIGTRDAELRSHIAVTISFLNQLWRECGSFDLRCMQATGILLERITRSRKKDWAQFVALLKRGSLTEVERYIDGWIAGHFLPASGVADAVEEIEKVSKGHS